jgi:hypothetical protein
MNGGKSTRTWIGEIMPFFSNGNLLLSYMSTISPMALFTRPMLW